MINNPRNIRFKNISKSVPVAKDKSNMNMTVPKVIFTEMLFFSKEHWKDYSYDKKRYT